MSGGELRRRVWSEGVTSSNEEAVLNLNSIMKMKRKKKETTLHIISSLASQVTSHR